MPSLISITEKSLLRINYNIVYSFEAEDTNNEIQTNTLSLNIPNDPNQTGGLAQSIQLAVGARVMLTNNTDTEDGLVNDMTGTVENLHPAPTNTDYEQMFVIVRLDDSNAGLAARRKYHSILTNNPDAAPVTKEEVKFKIGKYKAAEVSIFPLRFLANTIHKVQDLTLSKIVVPCEG